MYLCINYIDCLVSLKFGGNTSISGDTPPCFEKPVPGGQIFYTYDYSHILYTIYTYYTFNYTCKLTEVYRRDDY